MIAPLARRPGSAVAVLCACLLAGCAASASPQWDASFGDAERRLNAQQLHDPAAPSRNRGVNPPADGRTVREATGRFVNTFRDPPPANVITIGVGTGSGSGQ